MKIHEYQAKAILARHGVPVPQGEVVLSGAEAREAARGWVAASLSSRHRSMQAVVAKGAASRSSRTPIKQRRPPQT